MSESNNIKLVIGDWTTLQRDATAVRHDVFVIEQNVPIELELDEMDAVCVHVVAYDANNQPIGTARLLPDAHIGRMAVRASARSHGLGSRLLQVLMQQAQARGDQMVRLNAQLQAESFYARHGYEREGDTFLDAGIPHIAMRYTFA
jgi:predicted GNAT family N-acyltransferase